LPRLSLRGRDLLKLLRLSGLIVFPVIFFLGIDFKETSHVLRDSNAGLVLLGVAIMQGVIFLRVWRWKIVAEASGVHYTRFWDYLVLFYSGLFAGTAMPQFAASFAPVLFVSEDGGSWRRAVVSILWDRFAELAMLLLFAFIAAIFLFGELPEVSLAVIAVVGLAVAGGLAAIPVVPYVRRNLAPAAATRWPVVGKLVQLLEADDTLDVLRSLRACLASITGITVAILVAQTVIIIVLAEALSLDVSIPFLIMAWSLVALAVTIPISIAGLGLREGVLVALFTAAGESREEALALGLLIFFVVMVTRLPGALTWLRGGTAGERNAAAASLVPATSDQTPSIEGA